MLNPEQAEQIRRQIEAYEQQTSTHHLSVPLGEQTFNLEIEPLVANPEIMNSGIQVVEYLAAKPELVANKIVTDMGTGSGIIGIALAKLGARQVFMPDIDARAVKNTEHNIIKNQANGICETFVSDLFDQYGNRPKSEVQIFNHPFFAAEPLPDKDWTRMMLGGTELIRKYLLQAPQYSTPEATYIFPWLTLAQAETANSPDNDPGKLAAEYGFDIVGVTNQQPTKHGLQQSLFRIYELKKSSILSH